MSLIWRAIITGFGYKLGAELARYACTRVGLIEKEQAAKDSREETIPTGISEVPQDDDDLDPDRARDDEN